MTHWLIGGRGYIGGHLQTALAQGGTDDVMLVSRAAPGSGQIVSVDTFEACVQPGDVVVHLAWETAVGSYRTSHTNFDALALGLRCLAACTAVGGTRFVGVGTCLELPALPGPPQPANSPLAPSCLYSTTKVAFLNLIQDALKSGFLASYGWGRVFHIYGPGEPPDKLWSYAKTQRDLGQPLSLRTPNQLCDFIPAKDVAQQLAALCRDGRSGCYNLCTGKAQTVAEFLSTQVPGVEIDWSAATGTDTLDGRIGVPGF